MKTLLDRMFNPARHWLFEEPDDGGKGGKSDPEPEPAKPEPDPEPKPEPDPEPEPEPTLSAKERDDYNRLKREAAERAKKDREAERKRAEEEGRHQDVISGLEKERDTEKERADTAEGELAALRKQIVVERVARKLNFRDPADALLHLPDDTEGTEAAVEKALKTVKQEKSYLIDGQGTRSGAPAGGGEPSDPGDIDAQIKKAEGKGDHREAMRLKNRKLLEQQQG